MAPGARREGAQLSHVPGEAKLQAKLADGVAIYDASALLPTHATRRYGARDPGEIRHVVVHKSGADGRPGIHGAVGMANFCVTHRGWPGAAYTYWLPRQPDLDGEGRMAVYRCNPDDVRSYHTGGAMNGRAVGVCCQGNYDGEWDLIQGVPRVTREPTNDQLIMLSSLVAYLEERHPGFKPGLDRDLNLWGLTGHWEHGKPVCPGDRLRQWVETRRGGGVPAKAAKPPAEVFKPTALELQQSLAELGFPPGPLDGVIGYQTRSALEKFQASVGLEADGWYGPKTAAALALALRLAKV